MVDSNETSMVALESSVSKAAAENTAQVSGENVGQGIVSVTATGNETAPTYEMTLTSSSDGLGASDSGSADQHPPPATAEDRKCVGRETDDTGCQSEVRNSCALCRLACAPCPSHECRLAVGAC